MDRSGVRASSLASSYRWTGVAFVRAHWPVAIGGIKRAGRRCGMHIITLFVNNFFLTSPQNAIIITIFLKYI